MGNGGGPHTQLLGSRAQQLAQTRHAHLQVQLAAAADHVLARVGVEAHVHEGVGLGEVRQGLGELARPHATRGHGHRAPLHHCHLEAQRGEWRHVRHVGDGASAQQRALQSDKRAHVARARARQRARATGAVGEHTRHARATRCRRSRRWVRGLIAHKHLRARPHRPREHARERSVRLGPPANGHHLGDVGDQRPTGIARANARLRARARHALGCRGCVGRGGGGGGRDGGGGGRGGGRGGGGCLHRRAGRGGAGAQRGRARGLRRGRLREVCAHAV
mmetsp:Transcript_24620/g.63568  ORF Transcript_24620/g.63568 Transcript_24620/m.63568 type:complete len:277 (+) Transcript_24620:1170-2000(+)